MARPRRRLADERTDDRRPFLDRPAADGRQREPGGGRERDAREQRPGRVRRLVERGDREHCAEREGRDLAGADRAEDPAPLERPEPVREPGLAHSRPSPSSCSSGNRSWPTGGGSASEAARSVARGGAGRSRCGGQFIGGQLRAAIGSSRDATADDLWRGCVGAASPRRSRASPLPPPRRCRRGARPRPRRLRAALARARSPRSPASPHSPRTGQRRRGGCPPTLPSLPSRAALGRAGAPPRRPPRRIPETTEPAQFDPRSAASSAAAADLADAADLAAEMAGRGARQLGQRQQPQQRPRRERREQHEHQPGQHPAGAARAGLAERRAAEREHGDDRELRQDQRDQQLDGLSRAHTRRAGHTIAANASGSISTTM